MSPSMTNISAEARLSQAIAERVILDGDCLLWQGTYSKGMPFIMVRNRQGTRVSTSVRRFQYGSAHPDEILSAKESFYNTCGNPRCVNPHHLARGIGIGCSKHASMNVALYTWHKKQHLGMPLKEIAKSAGVGYATLLKYINEYNKNPEQWRALWGTKF